LIETDFGFQIVRVDERKEARKVPLEEIRTKLTEKLTNEKYQKAMDGFLKKLWSEADIEVAKGYRDRLATEAKETEHN
jgi:parvulin-like peptidyl-prolyl isomerase